MTNIIGAATKVDTCMIHGNFTSTNFIGGIWSHCPKCAELADQQARESEREARDAERHQRWLSTLGGAQIPDRFQDRTLDSFIAETPAQQHALAFAKAYAEGFREVLREGRCAIFIGRPGTGKTHLAVGIALALMSGKPYRTALFTTVLRAVRRVKETWRRNSLESETQAIAALVYPDLLILDEVGVQFGSDSEKIIIFDLLNERYEKRKPVILLSNNTADEVQQYLGERIFDRLREGGGELVTFDWESHRGKEIDQRE